MSNVYSNHTSYLIFSFSQTKNSQCSLHPNHYYMITNPITITFGTEERTENFVLTLCLADISFGKREASTNMGRILSEPELEQTRQEMGLNHNITHMTSISSVRSSCSYNSPLQICSQATIFYSFSQPTPHGHNPSFSSL